MASETDETPEGVISCINEEEVPSGIRKYWHQRYDIFSRFDEGIWMTKDSFFEATPEPIARKIADEIALYAPQDKKTIVDAFAGVGGNAIAFALSGHWSMIFAIEKDPTTLECAKHNAKVYGVSKKIVWHQGDVFTILQDRMKPVRSNSVLFASPPWGGPNYKDTKVFDLKTMRPYNLQQLYRPLQNYTKEIALYLPRTSDLKQIAELADENEHFEVVHYAMMGASKAICFYSGALASTH